MTESTWTNPAMSRTTTSDRSGPKRLSALATRSSSRRFTGCPSKRNRPAIPLIANACDAVRIASGRSAEFSKTRESTGARTVDRSAVAKLDPGVSGEFVLLARNAKTHPARYAAPAQHRMCGQRARQTKRFGSRFRGRGVDRPQHPAGFIGCEAADLAWRPAGPAENPRRRNDAYGDTCEEQADSCLAQISAPYCLCLH